MTSANSNLIGGPASSGGNLNQYNNGCGVTIQGSDFTSIGEERLEVDVYTVSFGDSSP